MAKLIAVIQTEIKKGDGIVGDPVRMVTQYFAPDGTLLAESDDWLMGEFRDIARQELDPNGETQMARLRGLVLQEFS